MEDCKQNNTKRTLEYLLMLVERDKPMKLTNKEFMTSESGDFYIIGNCPVCEHTAYYFTDMTARFCEWCGQSIRIETEGDTDK